MSGSIPFICWVDRHGRTEDLAQVLGWTPEYVYPRSSGPLRLPIRYAQSLLISRRVVQRAPNAVAIMLPPPFLAAWNGARKGQRIIFDVHSGLITDTRWRPFLKNALRSFRTSDILLAHNEVDAEFLAPRVDASVVLLQDPALTAARIRAEKSMTGNRPNSIKIICDTIIFPSSGDTDEPLAEFSNAASHVIEHRGAKVTITGKRAQSELEGSSVLTCGFLPQDEYEELVGSSQIVVALSTRPNIIQRAAFEAVLAGSRPVVAESIPLRRILGDFAEFVNPSSENSIRAGLERALDRGVPTGKEIACVRTRIETQEAEQLATLRRIL